MKITLDTTVNSGGILDVDMENIGDAIVAQAQHDADNPFQTTCDLDEVLGVAKEINHQIRLMVWLAYEGTVDNFTGERNT